MAIPCLVFNCSDGLGYKQMEQFFCGLSQAGAWSCFDEFNRIDVEVLSVVAQQMLIIQSAMKDTSKDTFTFFTRVLTIHRRYGVFVTMNPG